MKYITYLRKGVSVITVQVALSALARILSEW